jgi:hypothetical protein
MLSPDQQHNIRPLFFNPHSGSMPTDQSMRAVAVVGGGVVAMLVW